MKNQHLNKQGWHEKEKRNQRRRIKDNISDSL